MKTFHWKKQYFKVGDTVSVKNPFDWVAYPKRMKVTRIIRNKYGRVSYAVEPCPKDVKTKRPHRWCMLEEVVPKGSKLVP